MIIIKICIISQISKKKVNLKSLKFNLFAEKYAETGNLIIPNNLGK